MEAPAKTPWYKAPWVRTVIGALMMSLSPLLCGLLPGPGPVICNTVFRTVSTVVTAPPPVAPEMTAPPLAPVVEDCAPERRLSTGKCLP